jgi:putative ABC transport system permease protein
VVVAALVDEYMGASAYMELDALRRLMREGPSITGAALQVAGGSPTAFYERVKATPAIAV